MKPVCLITQDMLLTAVEHGRKQKMYKDPFLGDAIMRVACYAWVHFDQAKAHPLASRLERALSTPN